MTTDSFRLRLAKFLMDRRRRWIPRAEVAKVGGVAGYRQRISELRDQGFAIECQRERTASGLTLTWYRYQAPKVKGKAA
jgi:hypothetical protein